MYLTYFHENSLNLLMQNYFIVAIGAAFGGVFRYWLSDAVYKFVPANFPYGTLSVNVLGSFLLGFIIFYFDARELLSSEIKLLLTIGFCGGFTTFSTFAFETVNLMRDSELLLAMMNVVLNLFLTLMAVIFAYFLAKLFSGA